MSLIVKFNAFFYLNCTVFQSWFSEFKSSQTGCRPGWGRPFNGSSWASLDCFGEELVSQVLDLAAAIWDHCWNCVLPVGTADFYFIVTYKVSSFICYLWNKLFFFFCYLQNKFFSLLLIKISSLLSYLNFSMLLVNTSYLKC